MVWDFASGHQRLSRHQFGWKQYEGVKWQDIQNSAPTVALGAYDGLCIDQSIWKAGGEFHSSHKIFALRLYNERRVPSRGMKEDLGQTVEVCAARSTSPSPSLDITTKRCQEDIGL